MRNIKYIILILISLFVNVFYVNASCTDDELSILKSKAKDIKITYKHMGIIEEDNSIFYNNFEVKVNDIDEDLYISLYNNSLILEQINGEIVHVFNNGTFIFDVYSRSCKEKIDSIKVYIPKFNRYSLDPLCEGIDGNDFPLCGKYYEYDVSYDNFVDRVNYYRITHNVDISKDVNDNDNGNNFLKLYNYFLSFIKDYSLYFIISLIIILFILVLSIILIKRRKRGV